MTELQKASLSKRLAAGMLDAMLLCVVAAGVASLLMWMFGFDAQTKQLAESYTRYETQYEVDLSWDYSSLEGKDKENYEKAYAAFYADDEVMRQLSLVINQTVLITTFSILLAVLVTEFVVPLLLKNGQTLGKKAFGLSVMRVDGVQITPVQLFVRSVLGKFAIEIMVSVYIVILIFFQAIGKPVRAMLASLVRDVVCFTPLALILPALLEQRQPGSGILGVLYAAPIADVVALVVILYSPLSSITTPSASTSVVPAAK